MDEGQACTPLVLRVIVDESDIRKVTLPSGIPNTLQTLSAKIRTQLGLLWEIRLQYMDEDFNDEFVNLTSVGEIKNKGTVKVIQL